MRTVSKATMVVLAVGGLMSAAAGVGVADTKGGGARATGGDSLGQVTQTNAAQEGRQNNNCGDPNNLRINVTTASGDVKCFTRDKSKKLFSKVRNGKAEATGGDGQVAAIFQQNVAQEGKQNNSCGNPVTTNINSEVDAHCVAVDKSLSKKTFTSRRGAKAEGGDAGAGMNQQNVAQEGRQNNNCGNPNTVTFNASAEARCTLVDKSVSVNTKTRSGGAKAVGGDSTAELFQQNVAQEGRQNNNCGNPNNATLSGESEVTCVSIDESVEIDHPKKKHHKKDHGKKDHGKKDHKKNGKKDHGKKDHGKKDHKKNGKKSHGKKSYKKDGKKSHKKSHR